MSDDKNEEAHQGLRQKLSLSSLTSNTDFDLDRMPILGLTETPIQ